REGVQDVCVAGAVAPQLLENFPGSIVAIRERVQLCHEKPDLGARWIKLARALQRALGVAEAASLQVREPEVRVAEGIVRRDLRELRESGFRLGELVTLEVAEPQHARGV